MSITFIALIIVGILLGVLGIYILGTIMVVMKHVRRMLRSGPGGKDSNRKLQLTLFKKISKTVPAPPGHWLFGNAALMQKHNREFIPCT
jgi:hypothetical protein